MSLLLLDGINVNARIKIRLFCDIPVSGVSFQHFLCYLYAKKRTRKYALDKKSSASQWYRVFFLSPFLVVKRKQAKEPTNYYCRWEFSWSINFFCLKAVFFCTENGQGDFKNIHQKQSYLWSVSKTAKVLTKNTILNSESNSCRYWLLSCHWIITQLHGNLVVAA